MKCDNCKNYEPVEKKEWEVDYGVVNGSYPHISCKNKKQDFKLEHLAIIFEAVLNRGDFRIMGYNFKTQQGQILINDLTPEELEAFKCMKE